MIARALRLLGLVLLILIVLGMLGFVPPSLRRGGEWLWARWGPTTGGLVYVESPEVYTRQRLVNDRYLQDSWLRGKLRELDADGTVLISQRIASQQGLTARLAAPGAPAAPAGGAKDAPAGPALPTADKLPFDVGFALQSALRDKIRQLILENALDDRHDLSGNTVYGLKFDTAVVPGSNTFDAPAVVVRVVDENLAAYRDAAAQVAALYLRSNRLNLDALTAADREVVRTMDRHFNRWRENLEKRLNEYKSELTPDCSAERTASALQTSIYGTPICAVTDGRITTAPGLLTETLPDLLTQAETVDRALAYELRVPPRETNHGAIVLPWIARQAQQACAELDRVLITVPQTTEGAAPPDLAAIAARLGDPKLMGEAIPDVLAGGDQTAASAIPRSLGALLDGLKGASPPVQPLPGPWGELFNLRLGVRAPDSNHDAAGQCTIPVDLTLLERELGLIVLDEQAPRLPADAQSAAVLGRIQNANWAPLPCEAESCLGTPPRNAVWADIRDPDARALTKLADLLDRDTLEALIEGVRPRDPVPDPCGDGGSDQSLWFVRYTAPGPFSFVGSRDPTRDSRADRTTVPAQAPPQGLPPTNAVVCLPGQAIQFRLGAFRFLQRMTEVDSYIYAAFPRGDVTGVVTETGRSTRIDAGLPAPGGLGLDLGIAEALRSQQVEARPSIVNFAAGSPDDPFDFGWAITKDGRKEPMIASQLVLISVPAYLDEIELDVWKGFIDLDAVANHPVATARPASGTLAALMQDPPSRLTLRMPPDYNALDGIVIGTELLNGPRLRDEKLDGCFRVSAGGPFTLAIPGDRLWRSTVVTLDGLKADRIEVMPDMRGILATFDPALPG
ncbi:MAG: hypothetical protein JNK88_09200, partial [Mangrovicoccus sp.]|nr:hypothetical protein [Mangrovicoccus sp.]